MIAEANDRCLATAECVSVWFDPHERRSVEPPAEVRRAMEDELLRSSSASRPAR
jgi:acyl-CoA thioesterase FadM